MEYKSKFTVVYSKSTGRILYEIWEPLRRLCWPLPWTRLPGKPEFRSWEELEEWFKGSYPGKELSYQHYGKAKSQD